MAATFGETIITFVRVISRVGLWTPAPWESPVKRKERTWRQNIEAWRSKQSSVKYDSHQRLKKVRGDFFFFFFNGRNMRIFICRRN